MKYIIRFDDVTPGMSWRNFLIIKQSLEKFGIRSVLGVVPENHDPSLKYEQERVDFFDLMRKYLEYGDAIAQHGTYHRYTTNESGILGINHRSEFAGLNYIEQLELIRVGKKILKEEGIWEPFFMAPAHSFDSNTLKALRDLDFVGLTDGYGFYPYTHTGLKLIPALTASPFTFGFGYSTITLHTNTITDAKIDYLLNFVSKNHNKFIDFKMLMGQSTTTGFHHSLLRQATRYGLKSYRWLRQPKRTKEF